MNLPPPFEGDFPDVRLPNSEGESEVELSDEEAEAGIGAPATDSVVTVPVKSVVVTPAGRGGFDVAARTATTITVRVPQRKERPLAPKPHKRRRNK